MQEGGYCFFKCSMEILIGEEVLDIDIHTSNEPEYEMVKYFQPPFHMLFFFEVCIESVIVCTVVVCTWFNEPFNQLTS